MSELSERIAREIAKTGLLFDTTCGSETTEADQIAEIAAIIDRHLPASQWQAGTICITHGLAVLVTHVNDGEACSDYLHAAPPEPYSVTCDEEAQEIAAIRQRRLTDYKGMDYRFDPNAAGRMKTDIDFLLNLVTLRAAPPAAAQPVAGDATNES